MSARKQGTFRDPPSINFDLLYYAARYTILSPALAVGLLCFIRIFQVQLGVPQVDQLRLTCVRSF